MALTGTYYYYHYAYLAQPAMWGQPLSRAQFHPLINTILDTHANTNYSRILTSYPREKHSRSDPHFVHNFCESRLQGGKGPEVWNAVTSLAVTAVPFLFGFPVHGPFYGVACMLCVNGVASFYYHYTLSWVGKQADEISMILANHYGIWGLIDMRCDATVARNRLSAANTVFMYAFLVSNTVHSHDELFPSMFGVYVAGTLVLIHQVADKFRTTYRNYVLVSLAGFVCWVVSEHACGPYTMVGHPLWHVLFPLGFYRLLLHYDKLRTEIPSTMHMD